MEEVKRFTTHSFRVPVFCTMERLAERYKKTGGQTLGKRDNSSWRPTEINVDRRVSNTTDMVIRTGTCKHGHHMGWRCSSRTTSPRPSCRQSGHITRIVSHLIHADTQIVAFIDARPHLGCTHSAKRMSSGRQAAYQTRRIVACKREA